jgi:predicted HicB family RNase H-like nuclease
MEMTVANPLSPVAMPVAAHEAREHTAQRIAAEMFQQQPDWIAFFREVLGVDGLVRRLFPTQEEMAEFEQTAQYAEIQQMLAKLRERSASMPEGREPTRVITVRLPKSLHEALKNEAHDRNTSMNQLCISKLLQVIEEEEAAAQH